VEMFKKVVVAVGLGDGVGELLKPLKEMNFLDHSEIHFVHVFNTFNYTTVLSDFPFVYPIEADRTPIKKAILGLLEKTSRVVLPQGFKGKVIHECLFDESAKFKFSEYVNEQKASFIIVPSRKKRGVFESSFAQYVHKHTEANLLLLK
jgi:hypothetical protein